MMADESTQPTSAETPARYKAEWQREKARRVYYQDLVYQACLLADRVFGRSVPKGTGTICGSVAHPSDELRISLRKIGDEIEQLREAEILALVAETNSFRDCTVRIGKEALNAIETLNAELLMTLKNIMEAKGAFSRDALTHAENCITDMKGLARAAVTKVKE